MGSSQSDCVITEQILDEYLELTYLNKSEIMSLWKKFSSSVNENENVSLEYRIHADVMMEMFPQIKCNPYCGRICDVFSSLRDDHFSFDDILDFCSVMSERCPSNVKASWAFRIFDFNEDKALDKADLINVIDALTGTDQQLESNQKEHITEILLDAMDIEKTSSIGPMEFEHAISKMSSFNSSFSFTI